MIARKGYGMIFKRKIYDELLKWKEQMSGKYAILIEGARRIGKSTIVEEFAKNEYEDYLILDFGKEGDAVRSIFENDLDDMNSFFRNLFLQKGKDLTGKKAVIIFDEVQMFPRARHAIKYLVEDGRYDYIETGSLIRIKKNVRNIIIPSEEHSVKMYPMDFEEFLWAQDDTITCSIIRDAFISGKPLGDDAHRKIMQRFRTYMVVGGMPQAVSAFVDGKSYQQIDDIKQEILKLYENDLKKYDDEEKENASLIFSTIPKQLNDHGAHFFFSEVDKNARYKNYVDSVSFVSEAMIGNLCANVTSPDILLEQFADKSNFKLYMGDTGLLISMVMRTGEDRGLLYRSLIFDKLGTNQGAIIENIVAQMLTANGHDLFFHEYMYRPEESENEKKYEIDFLLSREKKLSPIEVKSSGYQTHKSFDYFIKKYPIKVGERFILYPKDQRCENGIRYLPLYMTMCL